MAAYRLARREPAKYATAALPVLEKGAAIPCGRRHALTYWLALNSSMLCCSSTRPGIANQIAPQIVLDYWIDQNGNKIDYDFAATKGKYVYLYFFQSWCPGCHSHGFPTIKKVADAIRHDDRVVFLAVQTVFEGYSINTQDKVRGIQKQYQLPVIMGHDPGDARSDSSPKSMRDYRSGGTPWVIIIDPTGSVVFNDFGIDSEAIIKYLHEELAPS